MENNVVCKAKIKSMCKVLIFVYVIIVGLAVFFGVKRESKAKYKVDLEASFNNYLKGNNDNVYDRSKPPEYYEDEYYLWGINFATKRYDVREDILSKHPDYEGMIWYLDWSYSDGIIIRIIGCVIIILPVLIILVFRRKSRKSKLELTDKELSGIHKKMFSTENINLPIDKVETAMVKKTLYNSLTGGKTVVICTSSGNYKFPWVQNADEFAQAVREKIDENKNK